MAAGAVERAVVFSNAYALAPADSAPADHQQQVREENDWIAAQVAAHRGRLVAFFSVNPLVEGALEEVRRCAAARTFAGIKLHLANSGVDLRNADHIERLRDLFRLAEEANLAVAIHLRTRREDYGAPDVRAFIDRVLIEARTIPVQVAHVGGWGGYDTATDAALGEFAEALARGNGAVLFFDLSAVVRKPSGREAPEWSAKRYDALAGRMRQLGMSRFVFGSDWPEWEPAAYWEDLRGALPLSQDDLEELRGNRAPWAATGAGSPGK